MAARDSAGNRTVDPDLARRLADRVRAHRDRVRLSQEALAHAAGVSTLQVIRVENARANPTLATLSGLAEALGTTVADLVAD